MGALVDMLKEFEKLVSQHRGFEANAMRTQSKQDWNDADRATAKLGAFRENFVKVLEDIDSHYL